uniref:NELL2-interacting cell ontogeny regulator 1 n=1 Tax=Falco tinnunculus TaxID=100819 RepID=A0A8C4V1Q6_FALTI
MALPSVWSVMRVAIPFISVVGLLSMRLVGASQDPGSVIPAESRPCVDCHAFEFMQRALQDLKKTAYNLDARVCVSIEMLLLSLYSQVARSACLRIAEMTSLLTHFHFSK